MPDTAATTSVTDLRARAAKRASDRAAFAKSQVAEEKADLDAAQAEHDRLVDERERITSELEDVAAYLSDFDTDFTEDHDSQGQPWTEVTEAPASDEPVGEPVEIKDGETATASAEDVPAEAPEPASDTPLFDEVQADLAEGPAVSPAADSPEDASTEDTVPESESWEQTQQRLRRAKHAAPQD